MSVPSAELALAAPAAVLLASLAGSAHCAAMCGPIVLAFAPGPRASALYQLGRGAAYLALGALAGTLGARVAAAPEGLALLAAGAMGISLVVLGLQLWQGKAIHLPGLSGLYGRLARGVRSPLALGALSALLPCGWLHAFVLASAASGNPWVASATMGLFWLGTLPALAAVHVVSRAALWPFSGRAPRVAGLLLIVAGGASLGAKVLPLFVPDGAPMGHSSCSGMR